MPGEGDKAAAVNRFVVLATPRSGSNWLCTLLDSHPQVLCHHELFNPDGVHLAWSLRNTDFTLGTLELQRQDPLRLLALAWQSSLGYQSVGFKLNVGQSEAVFSTVLGDPQVRKVVVTRRNRVRAYVSEKIAEASGQWESYPDSAPPRKVARVHVDPDSLKQHARRNADYLASLDQRLKATGAQPFRVFYEDISLGQTQCDLLRFLQVEPEVKLQGSTRRMNPQPLAALVENFDELRDALAGDALEADLADA